MRQGRVSAVKGSWFKTMFNIGWFGIICFSLVFLLVICVL